MERMRITVGRITRYGAISVGEVLVVSTRTLSGKPVAELIMRVRIRSRIDENERCLRLRFREQALMFLDPV
jgi:hypothetical protein